MKFPESTRLAKGNAFLACIAFIVYVVGMGTPYWLKKGFLFPLHKGGVVDLPVQARLGLFEACKIETYPNGNSHESCSTEGAADWQIISAALAIAGLVLGLVGVLLSVLNVVSHRLANKFIVKLAILFCNFVTCNFYVGPLILFVINKKIQVQPELSPFQVDFDLGYSYFVAATSAGLFALLVLLNIVDIIWSCHQEENDDGSTALSKSKYR